MPRAKLAVWVGCLFALATVTGQAAPEPRLGAGADWASHGGDADESDYSRLGQITASNVGRLGLSWYLDLAGEISLEGTPLAVDGVLYFAGSYGVVHAVDGVSGKLLWTHDPAVWKAAPAKMKYIAFPVSRGVAYAGGRIFAATLDGRLQALDAKTGALLWSIQTTDRDLETITGAPRVFDGKVIIGFGGGDIGARGYVTAYDQATGRQIWRFYTAPGTPEQNKGDPAMERAAATWSGTAWMGGPGGAVWDSISFDAELNRIYLGTGNAAPYDADTRSPGVGDNLYTASIVALDADTGKYAWHYQVNPRDSWDYDSTQQMALADLVIDGRPRKVLMQAPKNGFFYVIDRTNGKLISAGKIGKVTWADHIDLATGRPVERQGIHYHLGQTTMWPGSIGAHSWQSMSFSPKTGLVYVPYMQMGTRFSGAPDPESMAVAGVNMGWAKNVDPNDGKGALLAWDPIAQAPRWKVQHDELWNGGVLSTAGGLVFQGTADGFLSAYDAASGRRLWRFNAGHGIVAAPISYSVGGKQYVSVLVGYGGTTAAVSNMMNVGWKFGAQPRRLLTFALDGAATLPPSAPRDMKVEPVDDPSIKIDPADVAAGAKTYFYCMGCHGLDLVSAGAPGPDLRESRIALNPDAFWSVLHDGVLKSRGMPQYEGFSRDQVRQLYAYIRAGAREAIQESKTDGR